VRILIHSNGPNVPTGYGIQTAQLARHLKHAGHEVAISVYYGHQTGLGQWEGIPLLPCSGEAYGNDLLPEHALRWFDGDPLGGWIVTCMDVFGLVNPVLSEFNIAAWTPVDHFPVPKAVLEFFQRTDAVPVAMSQWGQKQLRDAGLDALYAPLTVDTSVFKPVPDAKRVCGLDDQDRFVVMMNGMNKGAYHHRKGFPEAFFAFGLFAKNHPDALLYVHAEQWGPHAQGINLVELAMGRGIPEHQIKFCDQYAYRCGFIGPDMLAAAYSAADVLLAPSRGEGFCVPLIEAQACGTPVIVTDFSAQPELIGAGWKVDGEPEWEAALASDYIKASIPAVVQALEEAYEQRDSAENREAAMAKAAEYEPARVFSECWQPILEELSGVPAGVDREPIPNRDGVAVVVPVLSRPQNVKPLVESFRNTQRGVANLYFIVDEDDYDEVNAIRDVGAAYITSTRGPSFAQKVNTAFEDTVEPWLFICGDDVRFHDGWIDAARKLSDRFDVIGTNDSPTGDGNPKVASGSHADHFFIRRSYVDQQGGCLGGLVCHEGYRHFYADVETVELAKARGVFTPCLESIVEHLHPDLGKAEVDEVYKKGWGERARDEQEWRKRAPLIQMQRVGRGKVRVA
jgi:glycosyltransferase involved in cell wall biosynthesis